MLLNRDVTARESGGGVRIQGDRRRSLASPLANPYRDVLSRQASSEDPAARRRATHDSYDRGAVNENERLVMCHPRRNESYNLLRVICRDGIALQPVEGEKASTTPLARCPLSTKGATNR